MQAVDINTAIYKINLSKELRKVVRFVSPIRTVRPNTP